MFIIAKLIKLPKTKIIYDVPDLPASNNVIVYKILKSIEEIFISKNDVIFLSSRFFVENYYKIKSRKLIIENMPKKNIIHTNNNFQFKNNKLTIAFIGNIRYFEIFKNLVDAASAYEVDLDLLFFGGGPEEKKLKNYAENMNNIHFFGKYDYNNISKFYEITDLVWAAYPSKDINVKYATSNKFYESLVFNKPCVFSKETKLGEYVARKNIGIIVNPYSVSDIRLLFNKLLNNNTYLSEIKNNIKNINKEDLFWDNQEKKILKLFNELLESRNN
jgi:glycosyltransferase involved in cell wall biosynthesis